jgi:hypothetical protein
VPQSAKKEKEKKRDSASPTFLKSDFLSIVVIANVTVSLGAPSAVD